MKAPAPYRDLRVVAINPAATAVQMTEIMPGIEDVQVEFALDTAGFVSPDEAARTEGRITAARVWLRVRPPGL